ncbi:AMP-dependent synthetase/ligase [Streptomyces sp. NPDC059373]
MRQFSLPPLVEPLRSGGLADSVYDVAQRYPGLPQLARRDPADPGNWRQVTARTFRDEVMGLAKGLLINGIGFGDRVALMARTRYEWTQFSYALWSIGAQLVPVYPTSSAEQVRWILTHSQVTAVVVEHEDHAMTVGAACGGMTDLQRIWQLDEDCVARITEQGRRVPDDAVNRLRWAVEPGSTAVISYTSGTTGRPKGCVITHANLAAECDTLVAGFSEIFAPLGQQASVLAFLPLSHIYGLMVQVGCLRGGVILGHQPDLAPAALLPALASFRPTFLLAVPYVFEKIFQGARRNAERSGRARLFDRATDIAQRYAEAVERHDLGQGHGPGPFLRAAHATFDHLVYARLRAVLGGRVRHAVSGGSPLSRELALTFAGAGINVYDGYGLTETTACITAQPVARARYGTVGRPLPGASVRIARDGEVWVSGETVFAGYLDDPAATDAALRDGWLATGDLGRLDEDGYLIITGRKKDIIITSGGKSVGPQLLEERLRAHPLISQCVMVGDNRPYIAALITLDPEALEHWQHLNGSHSATGTLTRTRADTAIDAAVRAEVQRAVSTANTAVSRAESIRAFRILPSEFTVADGLMTPSLKLRRRAIVRAYAAEIDELYATAT